jgi:hypothetical protein
MATEISKGQTIKVFIFNNYPFKSEIYEFESDLIYDNDDFTEYEDLVDDPELITTLDVLDSLIYNKAFGSFVNNYGSIEEWGQKSFNLEIQVVDANGNIVCQSEGFSKYETMEG